jgi:hypothetical protein
VGAAHDVPERAALFQKHSAFLSRAFSAARIPRTYLQLISRAASSADASTLRSALSPLALSKTLDFGVVYNRYPFPPPEFDAATSSCNPDGKEHPSITFWEASSQIRLIPSLLSAAADLYARSVLALQQQIAQEGEPGNHVSDRSLCVHWRRTDFKT